jgi:cytochrome c
MKAARFGGGREWTTSHTMRKLPYFRIRWAVPVLLALVAGTAVADEPVALLQQYRCTICHAEREVLTGPPWIDIATRYRGKQQANALVAAKIRAGASGSGLWHMPPHPEVSKADATTMAHYILSIKE